jgi:flagellin
MRSTIRGLNQAVRNTEDGISFIQLAEGALQESHSMLHRLRELAIQSANGILSSSDRVQVQIEVSQLVQEVDRIAHVTEYNKLKIFDGSLKDMQFHVGPDADQTIKVYVNTMTAEALKLSGLSISSVINANNSLKNIDTAVDTLSKQRADLGAWQNRLSHVAKNLAAASENMQAAESRIRDVDMAEEVINYVRNKVLYETGTIMLTQANLKSETALRLLK